MKKSSSLVWAGMCVLVLSCATSHTPKDPVAAAKEANKKIVREDLLDRDMTDFLVDAADARMTNYREGRLATKKSDNPQIRAFGLQLKKEQTKMLTDIRTIARFKRLSLPSSVGAGHQSALDSLARLSGPDFDRMFLRMMAIGHERDSAAFETAMGYGDVDVSTFARRNQHILEGQLSRVRAIGASMKVDLAESSY